MPQEQIVNEKPIASHTPGPWRVEESSHKQEFSHWVGSLSKHVMPRQSTIAGIVNAGAESEGNARLIAAAPELFDACLSALEYDAAIRQCANDPEKMATFCTAQGDDLDVLYARWITSARIAIAKVKGSAR